MKTWLLILVLAVGTVLMKTLGPLLAGGRQPPAPITRIIALVAPALISALIVTGTFTQGQQLIIDARAAGSASLPSRCGSACPLFWRCSWQPSSARCCVWRPAKSAMPGSPR